MKRPTFAEVDAVFLALSHEARRQVLVLLAQRGGELPSGYLASRFAHSWPTTTRHLKLLEEAGLVEVRKEGRTSLYRLRRERLRRIVAGWLDHLEPVGPDQTWPATGPRAMHELQNRSNTKEGISHEHGQANRKTLPSHRRSRQHRRRSGLLRKALGQPG